MITDKMVKDISEGNQRSYEELRQVLGENFQMDTSDLRRELFITKLFEWGIVTEEQVMEFDYDFHKKVEEALNGAWENVREQKKQQGKKLAVVKKPTALVDQHGRPLG